MVRTFRLRYFVLGIGYCVIWGILFFIMGLNGWQGKISDCNPTSPCFCETIIMDAIIREKSQTWSNLALILSGLGILFWLDRRDTESYPKNHQNPMTSRTLYSVLYGFLVINIGIGSFWFHGSMLRYAGFMDTFAMNMYVIFFLYYNLIRLTRKSDRLFLVLYIPTILIVGIVEWFVNNGWISVLIFSILAGIAMASESIVQILMHKSKKHFTWISRDWRWFVAGIGSFFLSFLIWNLSLPGKILCFPDTWIQGHSFWHIGVALSTFFLYLYIRSEKVDENLGNSL